jgi:ATP-dependent 26S proteasome regulatory subunit
MHEIVLKNLHQKEKSGIILFHGTPGTGKSTYIRHLVHQLKKKVIFLPPKIAGSIDTPDFTDFLISNANTVFVIEDAEQLITSRDNSYNSSISMLLNITDGLLGECLGIQIIATFNTHVSNIDKALLRKGRLIGLYEFKPLSIEKSKILLAQNGVTNTEITQPMTLADIYKRVSIGFASGVN